MTGVPDERRIRWITSFIQPRLLSENSIDQGIIVLGQGQGNDSLTRHSDATPLPALIVNAGPRAAEATVNFFTAEHSNLNTRRAYATAVCQFCRWCEVRGIALHQLKPYLIASYIKEAEQRLAPPSVKQHLAAIREFLDSLCRQHVLEFNPAAPVKGPRYSLKKGKTPVLMPDQARQFLDSIETATVKGLRDRALIGTMLFSFARIGAVIHMNVEDFSWTGRRHVFRLHEKGGKFHEVPAHHLADEFVSAYIDTAGIAGQKGNPLFRTLDRHRQLTERRMHANDALRTIKAAARKIGFSESLCCHTFRATGITAYLMSKGTLERAAQIACHESTRTTQLYNRTNDQVSLDEIEKIHI